jgi:proteasome lid subunit RPN8/RPN11
MDDFKENCWIIYGFRTKKYLYGFLIHEAIGTPGSVNFDWEKVFKRRKIFLGVHHTHPDNYCTPSSTDNTTLIGWVKALGKPIVCGIKTFMPESKSYATLLYVYRRGVDNKVKSFLTTHEKIFNFIKIKL